MKFNFKSIAVLLVFVIAVVSLVSLFGNKKDKDEFVYSELIDLFKEDLVKSFEVDEKGLMSLEAYEYEKDENGNIKLDENGNQILAKDEKDSTKNKIVKYEYQFSYNYQLKPMGIMTSPKVLVFKR